MNTLFCLFRVGVMVLEIASTPIIIITAAEATDRLIESSAPMSSPTLASTEFSRPLAKEILQRSSLLDMF